MTKSPHYPPAERLGLVEDLFGRQVADPYRWLEDESDPRTIDWSTGQDALYGDWRAEAGRRLADGPFSTGRLTARLGELLGAGFVSAPTWRGTRRFTSTRAGDQEHAVVEVTDDAGTRVLLDPMRLDPAGTTTLDAWQPSKEGDLVAYQVSTGGTEESVLRVVDVATGRQVDGPIDRARYSPVAWLPGGESFYYVRRLDPSQLPADEAQYHRRVWWHRVGADPSTDREVFGAGRDHRTYYGVQVSRDGRWLLVSASVGTAPRTDVWIADLTAGPAHAPVFREVAVGLDAEVGAWVGRDGRLYVHTDLDAPRGRLAWADPTDPTRWHPLVGQDDEAVLEDVALLDEGGDRTRPTAIVAAWRRHAVSELTVHDPTTGERTASIALPGLGSVSGLVVRPEGGDQVWFSYTDHTRPPTVYRLVGTDLELWAQPPGAVADLPDVAVHRLSTTSSDGTTVRAFVVAPSSLLGNDGRPTAPAPTVLYGYGGFQISLDPAYSASTLAWVEAGGIWVAANLRGGGEEGEDWHRAGMRANKQHVFDDLHAIAQALIDDGWTTSDRLAVWGGSNGGLLVGATITQRPDLYAAAVCSAPLLDMVRYQRFGLGVTWTEEYGDADVPQELDWLLGYSPYHHVVPGTAYPATLFTVFAGDTRVDPLHARKLAAALQDATARPLADGPVLLRQETGVGHGGRALSRSIALTVDQLQFVADRTRSAR